MGIEDFAVAAVTLVGVVMYAAAFVWLGLVSAQAIGVGLLHVVLWEGFFSGYVSVRALEHCRKAVRSARGVGAGRGG